ncbi:hypothetical protein VTU32_06930 [Thermoanaerobacter sp. CM-CNRG TB177]|nr:hypothetical protein [Thermoanaerobacter mathranii]
MYFLNICEKYFSSPGVNLGSWNLGESYAHEIIGDFNNYTIGFFG